MYLTLLLAGLVSAATREDGRCGGDYGGATCEHIPPFPTCCQSNGHCGWDCDSAPAVEEAGRPAVRQDPAPVSAPAPLQTFASSGNYRPDGKCGPLYGGAECDPNSEYWCCSEHGFCGGTQEHCYCDTCVNYRPVDFVAGGKVRTDRRCGAEFPLEDDTPSQCDGSGGNYCCSTHGYCGPGPEHCACAGCVDYRGGKVKEVQLVEGRVRVDRRCGSEFPLEDGLPSECDGSSFFPCCSKWGYCGPGADHCTCPTCVDYRTGEEKLVDWVGTWRNDRRCGKDFPLPDGSGPGECNPDSAEFCCSKWGFCGGDEEHCSCPECKNYAK